MRTTHRAILSSIHLSTAAASRTVHRCLPVIIITVLHIVGGQSLLIAARDVTPGRDNPFGEGIAVSLQPRNTMLMENGEPSQDADARLDLSIVVTNVTDRTVTIALPRQRGYFASRFQWEITKSDGTKWTPTFLPPPFPSAEPVEPLENHSLKPNESYVFGHISGISGVRKADGSDPIWYRVPPAGSYTLLAKGVVLGTKPGPRTVSGKFDVRPANEPVNGLQLSIETDATGGQGAAVRSLNLTFRNVGDQPLKLDVYDLVWSRLSAQIQGKQIAVQQINSKRQMPKAVAKDYPTVAPGESYTFPAAIAFPDELGGCRYRLAEDTIPYRVWILYKVPELNAEAGVGDKRLAAGRWTGTAVSNEIRLTISK